MSGRRARSDDDNYDDVKQPDLDVCLLSRERKRVLGLTVHDLEISAVLKRAACARLRRRRPVELRIDLPYRTLIQIGAYLQHHQGREPQPVAAPLRVTALKAIVPDAWDATFIDDVFAHCKQDLYDLILGAMQLQIDGLFHLGCIKIASLIKNQPYEIAWQALHPDLP